MRLTNLNSRGPAQEDENSDRRQAASLSRTWDTKISAVRVIRRRLQRVHLRHLGRPFRAISFRFDVGRIGDADGVIFLHFIDSVESAEIEHLR